MGFLDSAYYIGGPVGNAIVGPLLDAGGYVAAFSTSIAIYFFSILYVFLKVHPIPQEDREQMETKSVCDVERLSEAVRVTIKPRPDRATVHILLLILAMLFDSLPVSGEGTVKYLFTQLALDWTHTEYSHWSTFASVLSALSLIVIVPLMTVVLKVPDGWMGVVGGLSRTASNVFYGFVNNPWDEWLIWAGMYGQLLNILPKTKNMTSFFVHDVSLLCMTGAGVASLKNLAPVAIRSMLSKLAGPQDVGKVYAVMATSESLIGFASAPMYTAVYAATNDYRPGTYNFLSAGINSLLALTLLGVTLSLRQIKARQSASTAIPIE
ncbi:hypothetical protein SK128_015378 [Halocaridina rubra]|uniref:Uncharacterized protein n=1 Tax=Halocaridina rubra TaxID=373956 RepID=A0AAN9A7B7_HALRR